jgi:putative tricarboxylic transport membrane protein
MVRTGSAAAPRRVNPRDAAAGLVLVLLGLFFAWNGRGLAVGTADQMGPGYFPLVLAGLLVLLGLGVLAGSLVTPPQGIGVVPWRGVGLTALAILLFGVAVRPLGLGPALAMAVFLAALASRRFRPVPALVLTACMVLFAWAVFIKGLSVPIRMLGPWFG